MSTQTTHEKAQHTPGPWEVELCRLSPDDYVRGFSIRAKGKKAGVCGAGVYEAHVLTTPLDVHSYSDPFRSELLASLFTPEEAEANAYLIASAPELKAQVAELTAQRDALLAAAKAIITPLADGKPISVDEFSALERAIAQATGKGEGQ